MKLTSQYQPHFQIVQAPQPEHRVYYTIRHLTRFRYSRPISESSMEVRMQPRNEALQRSLKFHLTTEPESQILTYTDYLENTVHHFNVPGKHAQLTITAEATVENASLPPLPDALPSSAWDVLDTPAIHDEFLDMLLPSYFARPGAMLHQFKAEQGIQRLDDPLSTMLELKRIIYNAFAYMPHSTRVDSPIEDALTTRRGVCQDFVHITIALVRDLGIPCRYVSGYLFHRREDHDRSEEDATHAWLEAWLPALGWVGFDPTNNLIASERHIRTAIGRDYNDVPPTRGVFRGVADSQLDVGVRVAPAEAPIPQDEELLPVMVWSPPDPDEDNLNQQQQQQQQ
ncbi:MAG: transglutaminase family protein [Chloroflexaceae bacterium]|nr:transglutaminase family protein [Chloroflexaceae bacterium]NJO05235.1 transglutaminase family protein [Chloroflexaceae bacterium]